MSSARANIITYPLNSITRSSSNDFAECEMNRYGMKGIGPPPYNRDFTSKRENNSPREAISFE